MRKILLVKPPFNGLTYPGSPKGPELLRAAVRANGIGVETMITDLQLSWQRKEDYLGQFAQTLEGMGYAP